MLIRTLSAGALFALLASTPASAQDKYWERRVRIGVGPQIVPAYPGADKMQVQPFGDLSVARIGRTFAFEAPDQSIGFNLLGREGLGIGPAINIQNNRRDRDVGVPIGKVDTTVEVGGFLHYQFGENFRVRGELRKGVNGHEGLVGEVSADVIWRDGDAYVFSIGPRATITDKKYQRAYFGVTPAQATATGLPVFTSGGGFQSVGALAGVSYQLSERWGVLGYARYDRLIDDPARSPLVRQYGSRDQFGAGLALTYTFNIRIPTRSSSAR
jgi:outer membrane scaffolding protein for murein synthesis (MipA/OmpV family)